MTAKYFGFNAPFFSNGRILDYQEDVRLIKNDLIQLILTSPGERIMRPTFGTRTRRTLFEGITNGTLSILRDDIFNAINRWEPRVIINNLNIVNQADENKITIQFEGALSLDPSRELRFELDIQFNKPTPRPQ